MPRRVQGLGILGGDDGGTGEVAPVSANVIITEAEDPITTESEDVLITETEVW